MSGRKQFDVEARLRDVMLVFWQQGYAATSLDMLGAATGLGRGSLYGTFGLKDELFRRTLDLYATIYGRRYEAALAEARDPKDVVTTFLATTLERLAETDTPTGCLLAQSVVDGPSLDDVSRYHAQALLDRQIQRVRTALTGTGLHDGYAEDLARFVGAVNQGLAVMHRSGVRLEQLSGIVETTGQACTLLLDAYAAKSSG